MCSGRGHEGQAPDQVPATATGPAGRPPGQEGAAYRRGRRAERIDRPSGEALPEIDAAPEATRQAARTTHASACARLCAARVLKRSQPVQNAAVKRAVVTVLKADISGSTPLGERLDPEELRGVLGVYFAALARGIEAHGGRVDKYIGDAVMAVFGLPEARADDPARAIRAALAMQEAIAAE